MTKKIIALFLTLLMILPMALACAETGGEDVVTTSPDAATVAPDSAADTTPAETELKSQVLPDDLKFGGETVVFLSRDSVFVNDEVTVDEWVEVEYNAGVIATL